MGVTATILTGLFIQGGDKMARRTSTRYRIVERASQIENLADRITEQLQFIDDLADGRSDYINETLPMLTVLTDEYKKAIMRFKEGL